MSRVSKSTNTSTSKSANQQSPILHDMPTTPLTKAGTNLFQLMLVVTCCSWIFGASSILITYIYLHLLLTYTHQWKMQMDYFMFAGCCQAFPGMSIPSQNQK